MIFDWVGNEKITSLNRETGQRWREGCGWDGVSASAKSKEHTKGQKSKLSRAPRVFPVEGQEVVQSTRPRGTGAFVCLFTFLLFFEWFPQNS